MTRIVRKVNAFVEGHSTHLDVEELTPPDVRDRVETIKAASRLAGCSSCMTWRPVCKSAKPRSSSTRVSAGG